MATTSLWHIKGRIDKLIDYIENPDKTEDKGLKQLAHIINYTENPVKTELGEKRYVTGIHCIPDLATKEFLLTKKQWQKLDGRIAYHGYMSFYPGETDPDTAHKLGVKLAKEMWGDKYQVVVTTHLDKGHLHNHFAINSVSFLDGKKYDRTKEEYERMRKISDRLCREHGLSVVDDPKDFKTPRMIYEAEKRGELTPYTILRQDIDFAIKQCQNLFDFNEVMSYMGYRYHYGEYLALTFEGEQKPIRSYRLGDNYTVEKIKERLAENREPLQKMWVKPLQPRFYPVYLKIPELDNDPEFAPLMSIYHLTLAVLWALFAPYHSFYPNETYRKHYISPTMRAEIRKLDTFDKHVRFIVKYKICDTDDLNNHRIKRKDDLAGLVAERVKQNKEIKKETDPEKLQELLTQRNRLSCAIKIVRNELKFCDGIEERSKVIAQKLKINQQYLDRQEQGTEKIRTKNYERER